MVTDNIKKLMKLRGLTAKQLAGMVGVSPTHISYILNNKRDPSVELLSKIAEALEADENDIFPARNNNTKKKIFLDGKEKEKQVDTIAAHLKTKDLTTERLKILNEYIDVLFKKEF